MPKPRSDLERIEADPRRRKHLRRCELALRVTEAICTILMKRRGKQATITQLARRMKRSPKTIRWMLSAWDMKLSTLSDICDALGVRPEFKLVRIRKKR